MKQITSKRIVLTSFLVDLSDVVLNILVAILSGSAVMLSQAFQGVVDLLTSGLLLVGLQRARRRSDKKHHFGYGREIYFWVLMAGISMFLITSLASFYKGWERFMNPEPIHNIAFAYGALLIGLVTNTYAFYLSWHRLHGRHPHVPMEKMLRYSDLIEIKATFILDLMGSTAAVLGLFALLMYQVTGIMQFDGLGAMLVGSMTGFLSILLMTEVKDLLVGRSAPPEIEAAIKEAAQTVTGVKDIVDLRTMYIGSEKLLVNLEVEVQMTQTIQDLEKLVDKIKRKVKAEVPSARHLQVEFGLPE